MFIVPRTWSQGESAIRHESVNQGLANNLETFRQLATRRVGVATRSSQIVQLQRGLNTTTVASTTYFDGGSETEYVPTATLGNGMTTNYVAGVNQPCVLWVPFKSLNAIKKSSESIYIQVRLNAYYDPTSQYNFTYPISGSVVEYEYLGSEADSSPASNVFSSISWSSSLSSNTMSSASRIYLATEETLLDTSAMSTTDVSLAAFRFRLKQYVIPNNPPPPISTRIAYFGGDDQLFDLRVRVDLVIK